MSQPSAPMGIAMPASGGADGLPRRFGKYTLLRKLAQGGMAELFLALHRAVAGFEKLVVIKRILPSMNQDQGFIDMLLHEARIAATLSHPNVVQIFDVGYIDGSYYIAMEHIHGEDLRSIVRQMKKRGLMEFPVEHALGIVIGTCAGLAYAHEKRGLDGAPLTIVHRDISPQNILVTYAGDLKVVDFGIAKSGRRPVGEDTKSGRLKGKVPYMSPEQARGEDIDWRSDIFATGILLFELTTGKRLFKGQNELETLRLICERTYPWPSQVRPGYPHRLEAIVMRALAKDRNERYQSARHLQSDLESYVRDDRIAVSNIELSRWMQWLFEDRIAQQKEALQDVKQLADIIAAQTVGESGSFDSIADQGSQSGRIGSVSGQATALPARQRSRLPLVLALLVLLVVVSVGGFLAVRRSLLRTGPAAAASAQVEPRAETGTIKIESDPSEASIFINGDLRSEKTPATIDKLPLGTALSIKVTKEGYAPARYEVTLTADKRNDIFKATLPKGTVKLVVSCNVPGAFLMLDGKAVSGPTIEGVSANEEHKLLASAQGYTTRSQAFMAGPNENKTIAITLDKEKPGTKSDPVEGDPAPAKPAGSGKLNVGSRGGFCTVSVDGRAYGPTPVGGIALPAGNHRVTCRTESGKTLSQGVKIEADQTARVSFAIE
jgi:eukaryotic-like serine/threonine-protein kinase